MCIAFAGIFLFSARFGTVSLNWDDFFDALFLRRPENLADRLIWELRIPRFLAACLAGGSLALCGQLLQLLVRNPLADPYTLGTGSGAALGMQLSVLGFFPGWMSGMLSLPFWAFAGALGAGIVVLLIAGNGLAGRNDRLLLSGIAVSVFSGSLISFLTFFVTEGNQLKQLVFWTFGSLDRVSWEQLTLLVLILLPALAAALTGSRQWSLMLLGDEKISAMGFNPLRLRRQLLLLCSFITACVVCLAGPIGFVGLIVPYCTRQILPLGRKGQLLFTFLSGALFLSLCDLIPRLLPLNVPVPAGLISSLAGLPLFLYLLRKQGTVRPS